MSLIACSISESSLQWKSSRTICVPYSALYPNLLTEFCARNWNQVEKKLTIRYRLVGRTEYVVHIYRDNWLVGHGSMWIRAGLKFKFTAIRILRPARPPARPSLLVVIRSAEVEVESFNRTSTAYSITPEIRVFLPNLSYCNCQRYMYFTFHNTGIIRWKLYYLFDLAKYKIEQNEIDVEQTTLTLPVCALYTHPVIVLSARMSGWSFRYWTSSRTLPSRSPKGRKSIESISAAVEGSYLLFNKSLITLFVKVSIPQSVWWKTAISRVPSSCWEIIRLRRASLLFEANSLREHETQSVVDLLTRFLQHSWWHAHLLLSIQDEILD